MRIVLLVLLAATFLRAQTPNLTDSNLPALVTFVAPAYPRLAKDNRIVGATETDMTVNADGRVSDAKKRWHRQAPADIGDIRLSRIAEDCPCQDSSSVYGNVQLSPAALVLATSAKLLLAGDFTQYKKSPTLR